MPALHTFAEIREISDKWNESLQEKNKFLSAKKGTATEFWSSHHEYDNAIEEYRILSGYLARIEHFALGVNTGIYDVKVTERAATAYLTMLYKKLEPLILAKNKGKNNSSSENKYHTEFMKLVSALFHDLCKHGKWHKIQNGNRAGKSQGGLPPVIAY